MNTNTNNIGVLASELTGITNALYLLSEQFAFTNENCRMSNEIICGTLHSIASHIERITDDLDNIEVNS